MTKQMIKNAPTAGFPHQPLPQICFAYLLLFFLCCSTMAFAQTMPKEELIFLTAEWKGDRFPDGPSQASRQFIGKGKEHQY
jgi:hypothetical protein